MYLALRPAVPSHVFIRHQWAKDELKLQEILLSFGFVAKGAPGNLEEQLQ